MFSKISIIALAALAAAQHTPTTQITGNAITRPLNEIVPACKPFTIEWTPSTPNSVSLILLKGPSNNVVPFGPPIVVGIPNSGRFVWTPPANADATTGPTGYGIQIIDDVNGQFQYSTQFGISKDACGAVPASSKPSATPSPTSYPTGYPTDFPTTKPVSSAPSPSSKVTLSTLSTSSVPSYGNSSVSIPSYTPTQIYPSATNPVTSRLPQATGAASAFSASLGLIGAAAVAAFIL